MATTGSPGGDAGPLHADVDLDDDRQDAGAGARGLGQFAQVHEAVDRDDRIGQVREDRPGGEA